MKVAVLALLGGANAIRFLGDEAPVWEDSKIMQDAKAYGAGDDKFGRFMAFQKRKSEGKDDYSDPHNLQFYDPNSKENEKQSLAKTGDNRAQAPKPAPEQAPQQKPVAAAEQKKVFYFEGEDMVKRDAMVQQKADNFVRGQQKTEDDDFVQLKDDAEYPFLHVHTENGDDVDPITREVVNPVKGYDKRNTAGRMLIQLQDEQRYPEPRRIVAI